MHACTPGMQTVCFVKQPPSPCWPPLVLPCRYALIEFGTRKEAEAAIKGMNGSKIMGKAVKVDWAFVKADGRR